MVKPQKHAVYLRCMSLFRGENAKMRQLKSIRKLLLLKQNKPIIGPLRKNSTFEEICEVIKELLEQEVFESTIKAKLCFPHLFQISPGRSAQRAESEAEAARSEAEAIEEAMSSEDEAIAAPEEASIEEQGIISTIGVRKESKGRNECPASRFSTLMFLLKSIRYHKQQPPIVLHLLPNRSIRCTYRIEPSIGFFALSSASLRKHVLNSVKPLSQSL